MNKTRKIIANLFSLLKIAWNEDKKFLIGYFATSLISVVFLFIVYFLYKLMIDQVFQGLVNNKTAFVFIIIF